MSDPLAEDGAELASAPRPGAGEGWRPFQPRLEDHAPPLRDVAALLGASDEDARVAALEEEIERAKGEQPPLRQYVAALLILRDLTQIGWEVQAAGDAIAIRPHDAQEAGPTKDAVRRQLLFGREDQLRSPSVRQFIEELEQPSRGARYESILNLIADGRRLAAALRPIAARPRAQRAEMLREVCRPYLQAAETGVRDRFTNIDLYQIWRYFRHTWSSRYRRSPGRTLAFLIRDAAQPHHPVVAIASLSNAVMQLTPRDEWIGWTLEGLLARIRQGDLTDAEALETLQRRVRLDLAALYTEDLGFDGNAPPILDDDLERRLLEVERTALSERGERLKEVGVERKVSLESEDLLERAKSPLFRTKRASTARVLLRAHRAFAAATGTLAEVIADSEARWAAELSLRHIKQHFASSAIMEIATCGAAPPYGHLLAGKLVCLMMASPTVVSAYRSRYEGEASIIASQMAGRPITKDPALALLGTTSLYPERSSQYNRVRLPIGAIAGQVASVDYVEVGRSGGHGSTNLSVDAEEALAELAAERREFQNVNFVFGEGQSPKMRQIREGLAALGLGASDLIHHGSPRIVYVVPLARNTHRFLLGADSAPEYAFPLDDDGGEAIAEYWRSRWLASRLDHTKALDALAQTSPENLRISRDWSAARPEVQRLLF
ncbi:Druantia anti-phage system protein DruA [Polyangium aurulentum]|uniref:Druantia anti-phage system protein DruA n=1 Tax=Polyangium aurulentum TaxID=2567896 RepID=UPI0010AEB074|nr:Druantia anti-phage system protein DruA [Polyangium aurulentum]UQA57439.1 DUF4338 domain-containing protein [Polyangium aurulentum]